MPEAPTSQPSTSTSEVDHGPSQESRANAPSEHVDLTALGESVDGETDLPAATTADIGGRLGDIEGHLRFRSNDWSHGVMWTFVIALALNATVRILVPWLAPEHALLIVLVYDGLTLVSFGCLMYIVTNEGRDRGWRGLQADRRARPGRNPSPNSSSHKEDAGDANPQRDRS